MSLKEHEASTLSVCLNYEQQTQTQRNAVADKFRFYEYCNHHNIPTVPILAVYSQREVTYGKELVSKSEPKQSIFIKPTIGARGEGTLAWVYRKDGLYESTQGIVLHWNKVHEYLKALSHDKSILVQPFLQNHPSIRDLALHGLSTIRVVTGITPLGQVEPIAATYKMPKYEDRIISTNGLNSAIDLKTGKIGIGYTYEPLCDGYSIHPTTAEAIADRVLPDWNKVLDLVRSAHGHFSGFVFLGWDVALTEQGPILLEANSGWEVLMIQKPQQQPLGKTLFMDICTMWLDKKNPSSSQP